MQLIGMLDSPYVRRVAISLKRLEIPFEHRSLSVFRQFDEFQQINPLVRAPTLVCDDGTVLADSTLILSYVERLAHECLAHERLAQQQLTDRHSLMPTALADSQRALYLIGLGLNACDKTVQAYYERTLRPAEKFHQPWFDRVQGQLHRTYQLLEAEMADRTPWLVTDQMMQPDITVAVAWRFTQYYLADAVTAEDYPGLVAFSAEVEKTPEFVSTPLP